MNKKIALSLFLLANNQNLFSQANEINNDNKLLVLNKENNNYSNEQNEEEKDSTAFLHALNEEFSPEELLEFKKTSLEERLKKIPQGKESDVLKSIEFMKYARYTLLDIKYNVHPVELISKADLDGLQMNDFRENISSTIAELQIKKLVKNSIRTIKNTINQEIDNNNKSIKVESIKNALLKKEYIEQKEKFDDVIALFNNLEKMKTIKEKQWFDLFAMKDIGLELVDKNIVDEIPIIKDNSKKKDLLCLVDITKIVKSNIFQELSVPKVSSLSDSAFFENLEKIQKMAYELAMYKDFIAQQQIQGKEFLKFLSSMSIDQQQERENLKKISSEDELATKVTALKYSGNHTQNLEKTLHAWLKRNKKANAEQINKLADFGTICLNDIKRKYDEDDSPINFNYFLDVITLYLHEKEGAIIQSKSFNKFKSEYNKSNIVSSFKTIDSVIQFIDETLYNPGFITISKDGIGVNSKYLSAMQSKIIQWEEIKDKFIEINNKKGFANYINLIKIKQDNIKDKYLMQSIFSNKISFMVLSENIRDFAGKFIKKELPEDKEVKIDPNIDRILFYDFEILPRNFIKFNTKGSVLDIASIITGINGHSGAGKSLIAKNFIININLARVFGKVPSAKMHIPPNLDLKKMATILIRNQGEIPGKLSNHQTNSLVFERLMDYLTRRNYYSIVVCDEILSGTNSASAERMIKDNTAIKKMIASGNLSIFCIEHNKDTRERVTLRDLNLNFVFEDVASKEIIDENTYKKEYLLESDNPQLFNAFLDKKFFGPKNSDKSNIMVYFEIDKKNQLLKKITKEEYDKIYKRNPQNVILYSYTPLLNNLQNNNDRSGNITYDKENEKLIFNQPTMLFQSNSKNYYSVFHVKPVYKEDEIIYEVPSTLKFYETSSLIKKNSDIVFINKYEDQSLEDMPPSLLHSEDRNMLGVANEKIDKEHQEAHKRYIETIAIETQEKFLNLQFNHE